MTIARRKAIERREQAAESVARVFQQLLQQVTDWMQQHAAADGSVSVNVLGEFEAWLDGVLANHRTQWGAALGQSFSDAVGIASGLRPEGAPGTLLNHTLAWLKDYVGADGLQLSDRIWRVDQSTRQAIVDTVRGAIVRGDTARQAAIRMIAEGKAVPADVSVVIRNAMGQQISSQVQAAIEGNVMRNALRVTRTEINRAYTEAFVSSVFEHPDTAGVKFNLSPLHPRFDVCDLHAGANLHGMGKGVYPQGRHPYPAHPETLSYLTVVFVDEISDEDRAGQQTMGDWLRTQPLDMQEAVLGKNKAAALAIGELLDTEIFTPWRDVRARLGI